MIINKLTKGILVSSFIISLNCFADVKEELDRYQFELDTITSKFNITAQEQLKASDLKEKIQIIEKENPSLKSNNNNKSVNKLAETKETFSYTNSQQPIDNDTSYKLSEIQNELSGDQKDACGAILCLSSSTKTSECNSYLARYFSIKVYSHGSFSWNKTVNARKKFLAMCPIKNNDNNLDSLVNDVLPNQKGNCNAEELNAQQYKKYGKIKTIDTLPAYCQLLANHAYTDIKLPTYECDHSSYNSLDWNNGYTNEKTTKAEYQTWLNNGNKGHITRSLNNSYPIYYKHIPIVKVCWKN